MTMTDERLAELDAVSQTIHGEPFAETINKILCEYSAWVAMPNKDVAEKVAFAALVKATMITDCTDNATIDAQAATIARMREALQVIVDDYQTSPKHHPNDILIPIASFGLACAALTGAA